MRTIVAPVLVGAILVAFVAASDEPMADRVRGGAVAAGVALATMVPNIAVYALRYGQTVDADPGIAVQCSTSSGRSSGISSRGA